MIRKITFAIILSIAAFGLYAQNPPHPNGGFDPGPGNVPVGGGAPIGGGLIIMLVAGAAYGTQKAVQFRKAE